MDELSVKIKIADREYPMKVKRLEEERVRAAGKIINEKIKQYRDKFGIDDVCCDGAVIAVARRYSESQKYHRR